MRFFKNFLKTFLALFFYQIHDFRQFSFLALIITFFSGFSLVRGTIPNNTLWDILVFADKSKWKLINSYISKNCSFRTVGNWWLKSYVIKNRAPAPAPKFPEKKIGGSAGLDVDADEIFNLFYFAKKKKQKGVSSV